MTAIAMKSRLNPLANAFFPSSHPQQCKGKSVIPSSSVKMDERKAITWKSSEDERKAITWKWREDERKAITRKWREDERKAITWKWSGDERKAITWKSSEDERKVIPRKSSKDKHSRGIQVIAIFGILHLKMTVHELRREWVESVLSFSCLSYFMNLEQSRLKKLERLELPVRSSNRHGSIVEDSTDYIDTPEISVLEEDEECSCPRIFGWIIPPDFFGNPLNLKYDCNKRHVHTSTPTETKSVKNVDVFESNDLKTNGSTLEECSLQMKNIVSDVCDIVSHDPDPITEWDEKYKIQDYLEISDDELDNGDYDNEKLIGCSRLPPASEISSSLELLDDGFHPLLQSVASSNSEEDENRRSIEAIEKILGDSLMPDTDLLKPKSLDCGSLNLGSQVICNPPCSVWCDFLPSAAKDTFKKFLKISERTKDTGIGNEQKLVDGRPIYGRSFSADDAPMYKEFSRDVFRRTAATASKERLSLLRRNPVYFKHHGANTLKDSKRQYRSHLDVSDCQIRDGLKNYGDDSNMWGKFAGPDSLWQPLPDCLSSNEHHPKPNANRRAREMRRQKSIN